MSSRFHITLAFFCLAAAAFGNWYHPDPDGCQYMQWLALFNIGIAIYYKIPHKDD